MTGYFNPIDHPLLFALPSRNAFSAWTEYVPLGMLLVELLEPQLVVELGVHNGVSYCAMCEAVRLLGLNTLCYGVDHWQGDEHAGEMGDEVYSALKYFQDARYGNFSTLLRSSFDEALDHFLDGTIDLLHIDGYHTYEAVKHDFEMWQPKLSPRGVVMMHDINAQHLNFGVWKLWQELKQQYVTVDFLHNFGLGVVIIGSEIPEKFIPLLNTFRDHPHQLREYFQTLANRIRLIERSAQEQEAFQQRLAEQEQVVQQRLTEQEQTAQQRLANEIASFQVREAELRQQWSTEANEMRQWVLNEANAKLEAMQEEAEAQRIRLETRLYQAQSTAIATQQEVEQRYQAQMAQLRADFAKSAQHDQVKYESLLAQVRGELVRRRSENALGSQRVLAALGRENEHLRAIIENRDREIQEAQLEIGLLHGQSQNANFEIRQVTDKLQYATLELGQLRYEAQNAHLEIQRMRATRGWKILEAWWRFKQRILSIPLLMRGYQLASTSFLILISEGLSAFFKRLGRWVKGERRYYLPAQRITAGPALQPTFHIASVLQQSEAAPTQNARPTLDPLVQREQGSLTVAAPIAVKPVNQGCSVSYIIALTGTIPQLEEAALKLLQQANGWLEIHPESEVLVVADGPAWQFMAWRVSGRLIVLPLLQEGAALMPGALFNQALLASHHDWIAFALPGVDPDGWLGAVDRLHDAVTDAHKTNETIIGIIGQRGITDYETANRRSNRVRLVNGQTPDPRYNGTPVSGWLEMLDLVPMHNSLLNRGILLEIGGFADSPLLQDGFWWQATLRLSRHGTYWLVPQAAPTVSWSLEHYPMPRFNLNVGLDTIARLVVRYKSAASPDSYPLLAADFPELQEVLSLPKQAPLSSPNERVRHAVNTVHAEWPSRPLRITVLGGEYEPHHNQLFFFNYFSRLEGSGLLSWRTIDEQYVTQTDIDSSDLVIFSRTRSDNGCHMMDYANLVGKSTLYMLDDNWYTIGKEWPEYRNQINPGLPFYENAMRMIRNAQTVLTFNPTLEQYLKPHTHRVIRMSPNIDLDLFNYPVERNEDRLLIGYAGSPRQGTTAFEALVEIAKRYRHVTVFHMGWAMPDCLRQIPESQLLVLPWTGSYINYARLMTTMAPDIGIAPLGNTVTERSKIATKYMEYAASRCVGVYSQIEPYAGEIQHQKTGWLTKGESVAQWVEAIEALMDTDQRRTIAEQAYQDVAARLSTEVVLPSFLQMLLQAYNNQ